ncbi:hypothetical protein [Streptomyces erythrochromogenes]|uniref:hypothetical protein n=1 Tax=Streptomyces erythrochromogenes TaxID=285574 RepID=UPI0033D58816
MRSGTTSVQKDLRRLLNAWDPIGVADDVQDVYDCLIGPLFRRLHEGAGQTEIGDNLPRWNAGSEPAQHVRPVVGWNPVRQ